MTFSEKLTQKPSVTNNEEEEVDSEVDQEDHIIEDTAEEGLEMIVDRIEVTEVVTEEEEDTSTIIISKKMTVNHTEITKSPKKNLFLHPLISPNQLNLLME